MGQETQVITAEHAGFCFGVTKAVDTVYEKAAEGGRIYTYGPIIHNEVVVEDLRKKGVGVLNSPEEIDALSAECAAQNTTATVVIRSHGVTEALYHRIADDPHLTCIDTTCPFVQRIHRIVSEESAKGNQIVVIGNVGHAEVTGTLGWAKTPAAVIETPEDAEAYEGDKKVTVTVVAQTTFHVGRFNDLVAILQRRGYNVAVINTICNATRERQEEARRVAENVDVMIVIGGKSSSNSAKLYEICRSGCADTFFIQTVDDLPEGYSFAGKKIGITAGASTPKNIIEEVQNRVRREF